MREESVRRTLEEAMIVVGIVMVERARQRPVLAVDGARDGEPRRSA